MSDVTEATAVALVAQAVAAATDHGVAVSVAVVDSAGSLVAFQRMQGAPRFSADFSAAKARTAATFGVPTATLEELYADRPAFAHSFVAQGSYFLGRGGVPLLGADGIAGAVGVSGADAAGEDALARVAAESFGSS